MHHIHNESYDDAMDMEPLSVVLSRCEGNQLVTNKLPSRMDSHSNEFNSIKYIYWFIYHI